MTLKQIGLLGGTFDPIHNGHVHIAHEILKQTALSEIQFIPVQQPVHRELPNASAKDRLAMLELALQDETQLNINTIELQRDEPSYTLHTVSALANPNQTLYFIMAMDSFLQFHTWQQWQKITDYCHLIVVNRPNYAMEIPSPLQKFFAERQVSHFSACLDTRHGKILNLTIEPCAISATEIRHQLATQQFKNIGLAKSVLDYIQQHHLYQTE